MVQSSDATQVLEFICKEKVRRYLNGPRAPPIVEECGKVITSLYPDQFKFFVDEHKKKHLRRKQRK